VGNFQPISFYSKVELSYQLLPFRFTALDSTRVVMTNMAGEFYIASREVVADLVHHLLDADSQAYLDLRTRGFLVDSKTRTAMDTLPIKIRSRLSNLPTFTALHLFVVTLRCEHSCPYCQVSRQSESKVDFDMTEEIADKAIDLMFQSPSDVLKVEFQGGEPLLNFPLIKYVVERCLAKNKINSNRQLNFVITTNLALITDEVIDFCKLHKVDISTSLDGPYDLHNKNRPRPGNNRAIVKSSVWQAVKQLSVLAR
jgi:sulfatase maturation enzyme AslB (radical SAM superfamily)